MFRLVSILLFWGWHNIAVSQQSITTIGSRINGMGNIATTASDGWSLFSNPAGLASLEKSEANFTYEVTPGFSSFNRMAANGIMPIKLGVVGAGVFKFGDDLYSEQTIALGYANTFGLASLGITANFVQYTVKDYGRKHIVSVNFGGLAKLTPWLTIGAYIQNANQPKLESGQPVPIRMSIGAGAHPTQNCFITVEVEKDIDFDPTWKAGFEYNLFTKVILRSGVNLLPNAGFAGLGFRTKRYHLDYAYSHYQTLGGKHQASVCYQFQR